MSRNQATARPGSSGYLIYLVPGAIGFIAIIGVPFVMNVAASFTRWNGIGTPRFVGFRNYARLIQDGTFWRPSNTRLPR